MLEITKIPAAAARNGKQSKPWGVLGPLAATVMLLAGCESLPVRVMDPAPLDALADHLHTVWGFDGAFVVSTAEGFRWERGVGRANAQASVPFTPDTPTDGASLAKTFTATAVHMLMEDGRLTLDDPVARHLPEFPYPDITLKQLLTHSSGLPDYEDFQEQLANKVSSNQILLDLLIGIRPSLAFEPGSRFEYSSLGYDLAALVVERVSGQSYESFLRRHVFQPLGMEQSFVRPARLEDWRGSRTVGYSIEGGMRTLLDAFDLEGFYGGSNLYLSARDLDRWNRAWINRELLGFWARRRAVARAEFPEDLRSGLTLSNWNSSESGREFWYTGHLQGYYAMVFRNEQQDRSIVYVTNTNPPMWLRPLIVQAIRRILDGDPFQPFQEPAFVAVSQAGADLVGRHEFPGVGGFELRFRDGKGYGQLDGRPEVRVFQVAPEVLVIPGYDAWLWFTTDGNGARRLHWNTVLGSVEAR